MSLRLKEILKERGESISAFASKVGITQANMSNIVNSKSSPSLDTLERIASTLNVPLATLFDDCLNESTSNSVNVICPHCGKEINVELTKPKENV